MLKRVLTGACIALLAAGCGSTRNDTSSSGSTGSSTTGNTSSGNTTGTSSGNTTGQTSSGNTTGQTSSGNTTGTSSGTTTGTSSGSTTGGCTQVTSVAQARTLPLFTEVCLTSTVIAGNSPGQALPDGGSYPGAYYVADSDGTAIELYKEKNTSPQDDPARLDQVTVDGLLKSYGPDGGPGQLSISGKALTITAAGTGTQPTAKTPGASDISESNMGSSFVGSYVTVPAPTGGAAYTQDNAPTEFTYHASNGKTYIDGVKLTDGSGNTILVDTFSFAHAKGIDRTCFPSDGGFPDFSAGAFRGTFDVDKTDDSLWHGVVFFGDCADLH